MKKRLNPPALYRFSEVEFQDQEGFVPSTLHAGDHGVHGRSPILFQYGSEIWVLASTNVRKSWQYTAFTVGSLGMYEFLQMPYRLCNAPAMFQRLMQNCLGELNLTYALVYLDDVIVYSKMKVDHLRRLQAMFECFHEHGLKLKPSKCSFLRKQITFLGHEISTDSMKPGTLNLEGITEMALPANYTEVWRFLGMTGFFRRFIKNYAHIAKPLNDILEGEASKMKSEAITLPPEALEVFEWLKMCCMKAPVLAFADFEKEFQLETDASSEGLGAVLSQKQPDGKWHPVAFRSC